MQQLQTLGNQLIQATSVHEKIALLDAFPQINQFLERFHFFRGFLAGLAPECESALKQIIAIGQMDRFLYGVDPSNFKLEYLRDLLPKLIEIDSFYCELGGIVGYHIKILSLLQEADVNLPGPSVAYHAPFFQDIAEETEAVRELIHWGIEALPSIAEMYPLGGAGDRLHLVDEKTGTELPAAKLPFAGRTLLENLVRDLQAREFLYFQMNGQQLTTPIAIMTSHEKNNHAHVIEICEESGWFGRPKDSFRFFTQPLVPAVNEKGDWCLFAPFKPLFKPGGHGAIWKLARDLGIFAWLEKLGRIKVLIRQINNPLAGLDYGLLAFTGYGWKKEMVFGFASCPRLLKAAEGVNVLIERKRETKVELVLTNIEYCDFAKFGIQDLALKEGEPYSRFTSNTNILFADLKAICQAIDLCPFPGLLLNLKKGSYLTEQGEKKEEPIARLESTMQNIADVFVEEKTTEAMRKTERTFVTYNRRHKTISTAKRAYIPGKQIQETPENCFYDLLAASRELLELYCGFKLPPPHTIEEYLKKGPDFLFLYHPALGPMYSSIQKKLRGGIISASSELLLEIAEMTASHFQVNGSLQIRADQVMGHFDEAGVLHYSDKVGRCILENIIVDNRGVDWESSQPFWKMKLCRRESLEIILKGRSLFSAKNVSFLGSHTFVVEDGMEMRVREKDGGLAVETFPLT
ncbi:MAG: hypothetical protein V4487_07035 [Chlamydiota bacterium]